MTTAAQKGTAHHILAQVGTARLGAAGGVPIVRFAINQFAQDAIIDQLAHGDKLGIPTQDKAGHRFDAGLGHRCANLRRMFPLDANRFFNNHMATSRRRPRTMLTTHIRLGARDDDLDAVVGKEIIQAGILFAANAVGLHQRRSLARCAVVDADHFGQWVIAKDLDILAGHPAGADQADTILCTHGNSSLCADIARPHRIDTIPAQNRPAAKETAMLPVGKPQFRFVER